MRPNGDILFTKNTWDMIDRPEHVIVLYDRRFETIGVKAAKGAISNTFRVEPCGKYGGRIVRAASLCR
jgi:hypothetical protein